MKLITPLLAMFLIFASCAANRAAFVDTPRRINDAVIKDPVRRVHVLSRIVEAMCGGAIATVIVASGGIALLVPAILAGALGEFACYEFVLEPWGVTGYYWERGPRDDEEFIYE